ncbi:hypothetical protein AUC70_03340 [Methyloceanibacter stevinii]|uniref:Glycosyl transferase family 1 domain-containing protein n=1 Tax=Methyloceanibacter stevinii TaxID=1774970 RepID=A0A1E3VQW1_9HYPH|nr:glycosyltransferase [Methyloceanibacter stevinii]ODR95905.1 hypothetical protein AUC70_03340 [Methyloceanibacter stevinii]
MLRRLRRSRPKILFVVHAWGGGTIRFARELADLVGDSVDVTWAWGVENKSLHLSDRGPYFAERSYDLAAGLAAPLHDLEASGFDRLNVIQTIGLQQHISALVDGLNVPYDVTFTDYHHFSPTPHFEDAQGYFVGDEALAKMHDAGRLSTPPLVAKADRRIAISRDLAYRTQRLMPTLPVIAAHVQEPQRRQAPIRVAPLYKGQPMRVLVLGRPHYSKGLSIILDVANRAHCEALPIEILCLGETNGKVEAALNATQNITYLGAYKDSDLSDIVGRIDPHMAWFPFTVPETHSYALSDVLSLGLPVLATAIGAVSERVAGRPSTWLVPYGPVCADDHFDWIKRLYAGGLAYPASWQAVSHLPEPDVHFYPDIYLEPVLPRRKSSIDWMRRQFAR